MEERPQGPMGKDYRVYDCLGRKWWLMTSLGLPPSSCLRKPFTELKRRIQPRGTNYRPMGMSKGKLGGEGALVAAV